MNKKQHQVILCVSLLFLLVAIISPFIGQIKLSEIEWTATYESLIKGEFRQTDFYLLMTLRLPRVIAAILTGSALALSGLVMQACIQNPLADPYILGVSSGATAGATFAIVLLPLIYIEHSSMSITVFAFVGGIVTTLIILRLSRLFQNQLTLLILIGVVINAICQSLTSLFIYRAPNSDAVKSATYWTMGSLVGVTSKDLWFLFIILALASFYFFQKAYVLDLLLLGQEQANSLGIDSVAYQRKMMIIVAVLTSFFVSQTGIIGFVGLIVPHLARKLVGNRHRAVIIVSLLLGSLLLMLSDILARILVRNGELPIGVVTSLIGAPLFFMILVEKYKAGRTVK